MAGPSQVLPGDVLPVVDHVDQGLGVFLQQFQNKPRIYYETVPLLEEVQLLESCVYAVLYGRGLDNATGVQLDVIGKIVGQPRTGLDDANYRLFLRARILVNRSSGTGPEILAVLAIVTATTYTWFEYFPASMMVTFQAETDHDVELIAEMVRAAKAAGVWLGVVVPSGSLSIAATPRSYDGTSSSAHACGDANAPGTSFGILSDAVFTPRV